MALSVTTLTPAQVAQLDTHYPTLVAGALPVWECALTGPAVPDLAWLKGCVVENSPKHEVSVFIRSATFAGLVVVAFRDRRIVWECVNANHPLGFQAITGEINAFCHARYGIAWGFVENPTVRAAMKAAQPAFVEDGITLRWGA